MGLDGRVLLDQWIDFDQSLPYAVTVTTLGVRADHAAAPLVATRCVPELDASSENLDAEHMASVFRALGSPIRLWLLAVVQAAPKGEACVCDLVGRVGLTQSTVSHHLSVLVDAGLLRREHRGAWAWYALVPEGLDAVRDLLASVDDLAR